MPFGLKGAPAAFQREMDQLFQDHQNYMDDVAKLKVQVHQKHGGVVGLCGG